MKNKLTFLVIFIMLLAGGVWFYFDQDKEVGQLVVERKVDKQEVDVSEWHEHSFQYEISPIASKSVTINFKSPKSWKVNKLNQGGFQVYPPVEFKEGEIVQKIELLFMDDQGATEKYLELDNYNSIEIIGNYKWAVGHSEPWGNHPTFKTVWNDIGFTLVAYDIVEYKEIYTNLLTSIEIIGQ